ncbi:MAG TPA: PSD1 and planctomycete cytochrome C domain-containing protein [Bryobacteraceae bacterium]|nr:PSD1 and planctomycete cytochrome C domain-containing protein [Bryobacteraceae bacterium]
MRQELLAAFAGAVFMTSAAAQNAPSPSFARDVGPLLGRSCLSCHGTVQKLAGLDLSSRAAALKGGDKSGPAIVPGKSADSPLYRRIIGKDQPAMPLGTKLSDRDIEILKSWIDAGAPWDGDAKADEKTFTVQQKNWWAFRAPVRHPVPNLAAHPIDAFVKKVLADKQLEQAPRADRRTLLRRAWLDLVGLLPPPAEVEAFVRDRSANAWERRVDQLLASPHYGERWGRHWLDVARYADSWGHIHDDDNPNAWRFRDYVIKSFNEDKPYHRFVLEQLAGDELDEVTYETLIATGFHRIAPRVLFREKQNPHYRYDYLDDMVGTTSRAFLGLTVSCARCHDHKFDPISQVDYYRMMANFFPYVDYNHPLATPDEIAAYESKKLELEARIQEVTREIRRIEEPYREEAFQKKLDAFPEDVRIAIRTPEDKRTAGQKLLAAQVLSIRNTVARDLALSDADNAARHKLQDRLRDLRAQLPKPLPVAAGIRDGDYRFTPDGPGDEPLPGTTAKRIKPDFDGSYIPRPGSPYNPPPLYFPAMVDPAKGRRIEPGYLSVLNGGAAVRIVPPVGKQTSGRRRALAEWIVSPDNPLTARVMVNRIWHYHFGRGIVSTPSNFGRLGSEPSHPELLDWLATEFIREGWSVKRMHKLIMTSETYQMSSSFYTEGNFRNDPENTALWRFPTRRLESEIIRDVVLSASGQLNTEAGGPPFFPSVPGAAFVEVARVGKWMLTKEEPSTWRRSVYSYWKRARRSPMFEVFDQPDGMATCDRRNSTTVPTQALTLLNDEFVLVQARHFASRVRQAAGDDPAAQIMSAYQIALSRDPTPTEMAGSVRFIEKQRAHHAAKLAADPVLAALTDFTHVVLNLNEFLYVP